MCIGKRVNGEGNTKKKKKETHKERGNAIKAKKKRSKFTQNAHTHTHQIIKKKKEKNTLSYLEKQISISEETLETAPIRKKKKKLSLKVGKPVHVPMFHTR